MRKIGIALVGDYELLERIFFSILIYKKRIAIANPINKPIAQLRQSI